jgi:hypothetical protein
MGAPDSPVRRHITLSLGLGASRPLEALSSCGTGQSGATPDSPVPLCSSIRVDRCMQIAVAPLVQQTVRWHTGQSSEL